MTPARKWVSAPYDWVMLICRSYWLVMSAPYDSETLSCRSHWSVKMCLPPMTGRENKATTRNNAVWGSRHWTNHWFLHVSII
jgi:hypothetical protein